LKQKENINNIALNRYKHIMPAAITMCEYVN